jgi:hypothetical protein
MNYKFINAINNDKKWLYSLNKLCYKDVVIKQFGEWNEPIKKTHLIKNLKILIIK